MSLKYILALFIVIAPLASAQAQSRQQQNTHTARLGDLQVTVTGIRTASDYDRQQYSLNPRAGYKIVVVSLHTKNISRYPSCSNLDEWLHVKQGYEYHRTFASFKLKVPETTLPPTEESSGYLTFEIKEEMEPATLKLVRNAIFEDVCAGSQHRGTRISGPESVNLSLVGFPRIPNKPLSEAPAPPF